LAAAIALGAAVAVAGQGAATARAVITLIRDTPIPATRTRGTLLLGRHAGKCAARWLRHAYLGGGPYMRGNEDRRAI